MRDTAIPDCAREFCQKIQDRLDYYCWQSGQPPCTPVPQQDKDGICYCDCGCSACSHQCHTEVAKRGGTLCSADFCGKIQYRLDEYCANIGASPGTPVPQQESGTLCFCCCDCRAYGGQVVEVAPGQFVAMSELRLGQTIMVGSPGDGGIDWRVGAVELLPAVTSGDQRIEGFYVALHASDTVPARYHVAVRDQLYLTEDGRLRPVQLLGPGDRLVRSDGTPALVAFTQAIRYQGGRDQIMLPGFDGRDIAGHLLSVDGTVIADFAVQIAFGAARLDAALCDLAPPQSAKADNAGQRAFLDDSGNWPPGVTPDTSA